jgi:hypothetical protein
MAKHPKESGILPGSKRDGSDRAVAGIGENHPEIELTALFPFRGDESRYGKGSEHETRDHVSSTIGHD